VAGFADGGGFNSPRMRRAGDMTEPRRILSAGAGAIVIACFIAYIPAIRAGFIWDDDQYVTANPLLTAPDGLYRIWFSTDSPSQYFPLAYTTYRLEHRLWGLDPMGYHVVNIAIHITNALLLWLVIRRLNIPGAWFASAVFALHPVNVESAAWITERKNVLMLLFSLLSVVCWLKSALDGRCGRKPILFYAGSLVLYALALFSKATACTLPIALVLILWFKSIHLSAKRLAKIIPYIAMGIGIGILVMWWERHHQGAGYVNLGLGPAAKLLIAGRALWFYLGRVFWPVNLTFSYPRWHIDPTAIGQYLWPAAFCLTIVCAWLLRGKIGRGPLAAILFFAGMLFPMLGFFTLYTFVYTYVADHYQYAACIGPITLAAAGGAHIYRRSGKNAKTVMLSATGVLLITLGVLTHRQCRIYTSKQTLWEDTLNKNPDSWLAQSQAGETLFKQGKAGEAKLYMERAIELASYLQRVHPRALADMYCNLALIFEKQGRLEDAAGRYEKSLEIFENSALTHYRLAEVMLKQDKVEQAAGHLRRALEIARAKKTDYLAEEIQQRIKSLEGH
jgi:tetratricopeptide (TPR) repeat protein